MGKRKKEEEKVVPLEFWGEKPIQGDSIVKARPYVRQKLNLDEVDLEVIPVPGLASLRMTMDEIVGYQHTLKSVAKDDSCPLKEAKHIDIGCRVRPLRHICAEAIAKVIHAVESLDFMLWNPLGKTVHHFLTTGYEHTASREQNDHEKYKLNRKPLTPHSLRLLMEAFPEEIGSKYSHLTLTGACIPDALLDDNGRIFSDVIASNLRFLDLSGTNFDDFMAAKISRLPVLEEPDQPGIVASSLGDILLRFPSLTAIDVSGNFPASSKSDKKVLGDALDTSLGQEPVLVDKPEGFLSTSEGNGDTIGLEPRTFFGNKSEGQRDLLDFLEQARLLFRMREIDAFHSLPDDIKERLLATRRMSYRTPKSDLIQFLCDETPLQHMRLSPSIDWQLRRILLGKYKSGSAMKLIKQRYAPNDDANDEDAMERCRAMLDDVSRMRLAQFIRPQSVVEHQLRTRRDQANRQRINVNAQSSLADMLNKAPSLLKRNSDLARKSVKRMETLPSVILVRKKPSVSLEEMFEKGPTVPTRAEPYSEAMTKELETVDVDVEESEETPEDYGYLPLGDGDESGEEDDDEDTGPVLNNTTSDSNELALEVPSAPVLRIPLSDKLSDGTFTTYQGIL
ncbi:hypothetical protein HDU67_003400 [Dinochytrium kinnereticum]|nr:hypothetical protein HDU67_003400 [Dinochytrium kinnereticum]